MGVKAEDGRSYRHLLKLDPVTGAVLAVVPVVDTPENANWSDGEGSIYVDVTDQYPYTEDTLVAVAAPTQARMAVQRAGVVQ